MQSLTCCAPTEPSRAVSHHSIHRSSMGSYTYCNKVVIKSHSQAHSHAPHAAPRSMAASAAAAMVERLLEPPAAAQQSSLLSREQQEQAQAQAAALRHFTAGGGAIPHEHVQLKKVSLPKHRRPVPPLSFH